MKKSTEMILCAFPMFEKHINDYDSVILRERILSSIEQPHQTFIQLLWFFENPDNERFNLEVIYKNLDDHWLSFALETIATFFLEDINLIKESTFLLIKENDKFLKQSDFVVLLNEHKKDHGMSFSRPMLNTYLKRGSIPRPDLIISGQRYWRKETCNDYLKSISTSD